MFGWSPKAPPWRVPLSYTTDWLFLCIGSPSTVSHSHFPLFQHPFCGHLRFYQPLGSVHRRGIGAPAERALCPVSIWAFSGYAIWMDQLDGSGLGLLAIINGKQFIHLAKKNCTSVSVNCGRKSWALTIRFVTNIN